MGKKGTAGNGGGEKLHLNRKTSPKDHFKAEFKKKRPRPPEERHPLEKKKGG